MLKQINNPKWPSGDYQDIAEIEISDNEVIEKTAQKLTKGIEEGLGEWVAVGGQLSSGLDIELIKYLGSPMSNSYLLRIDKSMNPKESIDIILNELGIDQESVKWNYK